MHLYVLLYCFSYLQRIIFVIFFIVLPIGRVSSLLFISIKSLTNIVSRSGWELQEFVNLPKENFSCSVLLYAIQDKRILGKDLQKNVSTVWTTRSESSMRRCRFQQATFESAFSIIHGWSNSEGKVYLKCPSQETGQTNKGTLFGIIIHRIDAYNFLPGWWDS